MIAGCLHTALCWVLFPAFGLVLPTLFAECAVFRLACCVLLRCLLRLLVCCPGCLCRLMLLRL